MDVEYGNDTDGGVAAEVAQRFGRSAQPESQQVVAVMKAITDVIKIEGLPLSPASYFAAVMSALEKPETQNSQQVVLAMLTLLSVALPRLPPALLRSRLAGSAALVGALLGAHGATDAAVAKAALGCLAQILASADPSSWLSAVPAFNQLIAYIGDPRPKVRKRAVGGLVEVLAGLQRSGGGSLEAASELVLKVCQRVLPGPAAAAHAAAAASNKQRSAAEAAITAAVSDALHLIGGLKGALPLLAPQAAKSVAELLVKLYSLRQPLLDRHVTEALGALAGAGAPGTAGEATSRLQPGDLAALLTVVIETESLWVCVGGGGQAGVGRDPGLMMALGRLLEGGFSRLAAVDPAAAAARLPRAVHALVPCLAAEQDGVRYGTAEVLRGLLTDCLTQPVVQAAVGHQQQLEAAGGRGAGPLTSLVAAVAAAVSARYQEAWGLALPVVGTLITRLGETGAASASAPLLEALGALVAGAEDAAGDAAGGGELGPDEGPAGGGGAAAVAHAGAAEATLGAALRSLGPQEVLKVLPLLLTEGLAGTAEPRTWLLPLMRRHVRHAELGYWFKELLPLAQTLGARAAALSATGGAPAAALALKCRTLELQIWHCLPGFMSWCTNLQSSYAAGVNTLAAAFANRPDLHTPICCALQRACLQVRHVLAAAGASPEEIGYADPLAHGPSAAPASGDDEGDEDGPAHDAAAATAQLGGSPPAMYGVTEAGAALIALRAYHKQWLSVLCRAYLEADPEARAPYAGAIVAMAAVTDAACVGGYFRAALQKLSKIILDEGAPTPPSDPVTEGGPDPAARCNAFLELALWLSFGLPDSAVEVLFKAAKTGLSSEVPAVQKRSYKVLAVLAEAREGWLRGALGAVLGQLLGPGSTSTLSAARRYRLRLIRPVVVALMQSKPAEGQQGQEAGGKGAAGLDLSSLAGSAEAGSPLAEVLAAAAAAEGSPGGSEGALRRQLVASLVSDIVLCTKEANKKTRAAAYDLLVGLAHVMDEQDPGSGEDSEEAEGDGMEAEKAARQGGLYEYFTMVMAGLVGSTPHMVSATVMALARLTYEFAAAMQNVVAAMLPPVLSLLRSKTRETIKAVLGFVKVCAMRLPVDLLTPLLGPILQGVLLWAEDTKNKFKLKVWVIVERLARRCGFDALAEVMPASDSRLLGHIRREAARRQRRRAGASEVGSEAGGDEDARSRRASSVGRSSLARTARASQWGHTAVFSDEGEDEEEEGRGARSVRSSGRGLSRPGGRAAGGTGAGGPGVRLGGSGGGDPVDLLDSGAARQLVRSAAGVRPTSGSSAPDSFQRDPASGKMVIDDEEEGGWGGKGAPGRKRRRGDGDGYDSDDSDYDDLKGVADLGYALKHAGASRSVRFAEAAKSLAGGRSVGGKSVGGKSEGGRSAASGGGGRRVGGERGGKGAHSGDRFKAQGAAGDVKGKSKVEPYAYWSLDRRMLNRRKGKQAAATGKLASIVRGVQAGALKGAKAKRQAAASAAAKRQRTTDV